MTPQQFQALGLKRLDEQTWTALREGMNPRFAGLDYAEVLEDLSAALERTVDRPTDPPSIRQAIDMTSEIEELRVDLRREQERAKKLERDLSVTRDKLEAARQSWGAASSRIANEGDRAELNRVRERARQLEDKLAEQEALHANIAELVAERDALTKRVAQLEVELDTARAEVARLGALNAEIHGGVILGDRERDDEISKLDRELTELRIDRDRLGGEFGEARALLAERTTQRDSYRDQLAKLDAERLERFEKFYRGPDIDDTPIALQGEPVKVGSRVTTSAGMGEVLAADTDAHAAVLSKLAAGAGTVIPCDSFEESEAGLAAMDATISEVAARAAKLREQRADLNAKLRRAEKTCGKPECAGKATRACEVCGVSECCPHVVQKRKGKLLCPVCARAGGEEATS